MTPEPPRPTRRNRPDPSFRRRALGAPPAADPPATPAPAAAPIAGAAPGRESFRSALSRIPDLDRPDGAPPTPASVPLGARPPRGPVAEAPYQPRAGGGPFRSGPAIGGEPSGEVRSVLHAAVSEPVPDLDEGPRRGRRTSAPPSPPWWRRAAFAVVLLALVAAIPILGRTGYRLVTSSTDGKLAAGSAKPGEPGYEELVTSTPTALVIQKDAQGVPVNLTFLSLAGDTGGSVIFLPLDTKVPKPGFGVDRLRTAYSMVASGPAAQANEQVSYQAASVLNVGIDQVIELDDIGWDKLVEPVAPLALDNSDPLDLGGTTLATGQVEVPANLVGPYLASAREGEDDNSRFFRQQQLWTSWLSAVKGSTRADAVPGETAAGIGLFARRLAQGEVTYSTLPGAFEGEGENLRYVPDAKAITKLIADAVPAPDAAYPGSRVAVRLLNGVAAAAIPTKITQAVVALKGTVTVVGNGPRFGADVTDIVYADPAQKKYAERLRAGLGAKGTVRRDPAAPDNIGVTVILGKDLLGDQRATTTTSTPASGAPVFTSSTTTTVPGGP